MNLTTNLVPISNISSVITNGTGTAISAITASAIATTTTTTAATTIATVTILTKVFSTISIIHDVSPVTLSSEWSRMARLLLLSFLSVIGSVGNVFMISSVMIEDHLNKAGNAFIVNIALADLLVTSIIMPASTIVLLAGIDDISLAVCKVQWFFAVWSFLVTILSLASTSIENYMRLCTPQDIRTKFNKRNTTIILLILWIIGAVTSGLQFVFNISFNYCTRETSGLLPYQSVIVTMFILLPIIITFYTHIRIKMDVKRFMTSQNFKQSLNYTWDLALVQTNFFSFIIFIIFWLPFGIVLAYHTTAALVPNKIFYTTAWIGLSKSCFHNVIYCLTNRHFRNAYVNLFHYCCCKTTVQVSRRQRNDIRPSSDVRVHIIPGYNMYSYTMPQRSGNCHGYWNKRDVHEL